MNLKTVGSFLLVNFLALGIGGFLMGAGPTGAWYQSLNKAPWTPPGWVFGAAWTTIMICFSFYMAHAWEAMDNKKQLLTLFGAQWLLNVFWNPIFFHFHEMLIGLIVIASLTILVGYFLFVYSKELKTKALLVLPYFAWLLIATTLNWYAWAYN